MTDSETREKIERTDVGYRLSITSTRGTGTRDQDKVQAEVRAETLAGVLKDAEHLEDKVRHIMGARRADQPDEEDDDE